MTDRRMPVPICVTLISEEEKQSLTEALIKMLPENGQSYVIDGKESGQPIWMQNGVSAAFMSPVAMSAPAPIAR